MSHLVIDGLHKAYGGVPVLDRIDLELEAGEFCTIVGASGCGKSTLLKILLGQEAPTRGTLSLAGRELPAEPSPERGIVYQRYSVFDHKTVLQNVRFALELRDGDPVFGYCFGAKRRAAKARAVELVEAVGLGAVADRYPVQLSGGMQQRLALAQALAQEPPLLLLDEPFSAVDPITRVGIHDHFRRLAASAPVSVVLVTHDVREAVDLAQDLVVLGDRGVVRAGAVDAVRAEPGAPWVERLFEEQLR